MQKLHNLFGFIQRYSLYTILALVPLMFGFTVYPIQLIFPHFFPELQYTMFPYIYGKNIAFRLLVEIGLLMWLFQYVVQKAPSVRQFSRVIPLSAFFVLLCLLLVSNLVSANPSFALFSNYERMEGWYGLLHIFGFLFLLLVTLTSREMYHKSFWATLIGSTGVLYVGLIDYAHRVEKAISTQILQPDTVVDMRVQSTLGNAAYAGIYALFCIAFAALLLVEKKQSKYTRLVLGAYILGHLALLYTTITRSSWLGLFAGAAVFVAVVLFKKFHPHVSLYSKKFAVSVIGVGGVTIAILLGIFFATKDIPTIKNHPVFGRFAAISTTENTSRSRIMVWDMSIQGFLEKPLIGYGQESFGYVFANHYNPKLYDQEQWFDRAHNVFFDWLIAGGLLGLIAYLTILISSIYLVLKLDKISSYTQGILLAMLTAYLVHILFVFDTLTSYMGLCLILAYIIYESYGEKLFAYRHAHIDAFRVKFLVGISLISFLILSYSTVYIPTQKNHAVVLVSIMAANAPEQVLTQQFEKAFTPALIGDEEALEFLYEYAPKMLVREDISGQTKNYIVKLMLTEAEHMMEGDPYNPRHPYMLGMFLERLGMHKAAIQMLASAVELSPSKQSFITGLADAYRSSGDIHTARTLYEQAYNLDRRNMAAKQALTMSLYQELEGYHTAKNKKAELELFDYIKNNYAEIE